jgi:predicted molibdopterin-dependent oxidoreductase YjgC
MCDHGRLSHEYFTADDRPKEIRRREDARTYGVSAAEGAKALAAAVKAAREAHGDDAIAMLVTAWATNEELWLAGRYAREVLGAPRLAALAARDGDAWEAPSGFKIAADKNPNRAGLAAVLGLAPDLNAVKALAGDIEAGKVKVLVVIGGIPGGGYPDELTVVAGKLDFLAVLDVSHTDLTEKAHLTLPGATYAEKNGTFVNEDGRMQRLRPALTPPFPGGDLGLLDVLLRAGGDTPPGGGSAAGVFADLAAANEAFRGLTFNDLSKSGAPLSARETV